MTELEGTVSIIYQLIRQGRGQQLQITGHGEKSPHTLKWAWILLSVYTQPNPGSTCFSTLPSPSPPVRLDISGTSLIIRLQWSAMLTGCPLMAVPLCLRQGSTAAAAVGGGEVVIALPLGLQPQLVPVVLNVWLLLQSQVYLQRGKSAGCKGTWGGSGRK